MLCEIWRVAENGGDVLVEMVEAVPVCGEDFCDWCGDCLHCYGDDTDYCAHRWVKYVDE